MTRPWSQALQDVADAAASSQSAAAASSASAARPWRPARPPTVAQLRYQGGLSTYLAVLTAEDAVIAQQRAVADAEARGLHPRHRPDPRPRRRLHGA